jgi:hypothetical protein
MRRLREEGLYAETLDEAITHARTKNASLTGVWFVKRLQIADCGVAIVGAMG